MNENIAFFFTVIYILLNWKFLKLLITNLRRIFIRKPLKCLHSILMWIFFFSDSSKNGLKKIHCSLENTWILCARCVIFKIRINTELVHKMIGNEYDIIIQEGVLVVSFILSKYSERNLSLWTNLGASQTLFPFEFLSYNIFIAMLMQLFGMDTTYDYLVPLGLMKENILLMECCG